MEILVTHVTTNQRGQTQRDQRRLSGPVLAIGRGTQCQIQLPDPRVAIAHANITVTTQGSDGFLALIKADLGNLEINDQVVNSASIKVGDRIDVGPYRFLIEAPPPGVALALAITLAEPLNTAGADEAADAAKRVPHSKRRLSYLMFFGILLLSLLIPLSADFFGHSGQSEKPGFDSARATLTRFYKFWNPGTLSSGHQVFGHDCHACHQLPFVQVRDAACLECHRNTREHAQQQLLTGSKGAAMQEIRCAECHRDHKNTLMAQPSQQQCAACHREIKQFAAESKTENVTDFKIDHPAFRLSILDADQPQQTPRLRQGTPELAAAREHSNLKFNHALHLNPQGIRDPNFTRDVASGKVADDKNPKLRKVLQCVDCHETAQDGKRIAPISMERHCQSCHSLAFEPKVTERQVPHGSEAAVATMLKEFYARLALGDVPPDVNVTALDMPRVRPGAVLNYEDRQRVLQIAERKARLAMQELYDTRQVCSTCHTVNTINTAEAGSEGTWSVKPLLLNKSWMPQAVFSHEKHKTQECTTCHDVKKSDKAEHIAMPDLKQCQECHVGAKPVAGMVTSDCATCHKFHYGQDRWHGAPPVVLKK